MNTRTMELKQDDDAAQGLPLTVLVGSVIPKPRQEVQELIQ